MTTKFEYRVSWKRVGLQRVRAIFQTEMGALDKAKRLNELEDDPPPINDEYDPFASLPKLEERPVVERRAVAAWHKNPVS